MASIPNSVTVSGPIAPTDTTDVYPTHDEDYGKGGYRTVANAAERLAIPTERQEEGMLVTQADSWETYQLQEGAWVLWDNGGGGSVAYSNETPMTEDVGGWEAGSTFDQVSNTDMWTGLLYPYQAPAFSSFSFSGWSTALEVGDTNGANPVAVWATTNDTNIETDSIDIDDVTTPINYVTGTANDGTQACSAAAVTRTSPGSNVWRITGTNSKASDFTKDYTVNWYWKVYYGESTSTSLDESGIEALRVGTLKSNETGNYVFQSNNYKYICYPTSFGLANSFKDANTGFSVAMEEPTTVSVTNAYGQTTNYYAYRTTNPLIAAITITVA